VFTRIAAAIAALFFCCAGAARADYLTTVTQSSVIVTAYVHVHYLSDAEIQKRLKAAHVTSGAFYLTTKPKAKTDQTPTDENFTAPVCSGFVVKDSGTTPAVEEIVTARHCGGVQEVDVFGIPLADVSLIPTSVTYYDGTTANVIASSPSTSADVRLLQAFSLAPHVAEKVSAAPLVRGEPLVVVGMPEGRAFSYSNATSLTGTDLTLAAVDGADFAGLELIDCGSCYEGDSGAAVTDSTGSVIGVLVAGMGQPSVAGIVPASAVISLMERGY